jgi:hydroxypyruvate isomerase
MTDHPHVSRRELFQGATAAGAAALLGGLGTAARLAAADESAGLKGRIKQSVVFWCFNVAGEMWSLERTCEVAKQLGCLSVELVPPEDWGTLKKHGLTCAIAPNGMSGPPFVRGLNNPAYQGEVLAVTKKTIDACADAGVPSVIAFSGFKYRVAEDPTSGEISREEGARECVKALKDLARHAETRGVTVCVEHLNSRDGTHPMKGHPGYQGDDLDWLADIVRQVGSPRVKLLFDIYHVQVMHGDVIRRIDQCRDLIGHVHTAGNPGRGELDDTQEINYPPILRKLLEIGYTGYVGQEFIPTRDPLAGLTEAVRLCDV